MNELSTAATSDRTEDLLAAQAVVADLIRRHDLRTDSVTYRLQSTSTMRWSPETRDFDWPCMPVAVDVVLSMPGRFLRWAEVLPPAGIDVRRREWDTCLNLFVDHAGITWQVASDIRCPADGPHMPGISGPWDRDRRGRLTDSGRITRTQLRTVLDTLGSLDD